MPNFNPEAHVLKLSQFRFRALDLGVGFGVQGLKLELYNTFRASGLRFRTFTPLQPVECLVQQRHSHQKECASRMVQTQFRLGLRVEGLDLHTTLEALNLVALFYEELWLCRVFLGCPCYFRVRRAGGPDKTACGHFFNSGFSVGVWSRGFGVQG